MSIMHRVLVAALLVSTPGMAQETRVAASDTPPPPATIADAAWLAGQWTGPGISGADAHESWLAASGDTMVGTFVQETPEGGIMFTEHMYLMEDQGSLVVRLKHFNPDLTGWEEKAGMVTFRLVAAEPCALYFNALTYRCIDPAAGPEGGMLVAVRMRGDAGKVEELVFRFRRAEPPQRMSDCDGTTLAMNECMAAIRTRAVERKDRYLAAAIARAVDRPELVAMIRQSDAAFEAYREAECRAVHKDWEDGTIRTIMALSCEIALIDERTRTIWKTWLTYQDSTPPDLPAPGPSR